MCNGTPKNFSIGACSPQRENIPSNFKELYEKSFLFAESLMYYIMQLEGIEWIPRSDLYQANKDRNPFTLSVGKAVLKCMDDYENEIVLHFLELVDSRTTSVDDSENLLVGKLLDLMQLSFVHGYRSDLLLRFLAFVVGIALLFSKNGSEHMADYTVLYIANILTNAMQETNLDVDFVFNKLSKVSKSLRDPNPYSLYDKKIHGITSR